MARNKLSMLSLMLATAQTTFFSNRFHRSKRRSGSMRNGVALALCCCVAITAYQTLIAVDHPQAVESQPQAPSNDQRKEDKTDDRAGTRFERGSTTARQPDPEPERIQLFEKTDAKHLQSNGGPIELTFDDLTFEMEKDETFARSMLTPQIDSYNDQTIRLRGFIRPSFRQTGITKFVFVRDNKECCFGPGAALYDCVLVKLAKGQQANYTVRPIVVEGQFYLKEYKGPDGKVWSIFRIKNGRIY